MTIAEQIEQFKQKTAEIIKENPGISNVTWQIDNVPYMEFRKYSYEVDKKPSLYDATSQMSITHCFENCAIHIYSTPVKIKTIVEQL